MAIRLPRRRGKTAENAADADSVAVFSVGQAKFVSGLHWKSINGRSYMREARRIGAKYNWDIVAVRKGVRIQAGFIAKGVGVTTGMYSVASTLAGILGDKWIGAFRIDSDRYVVVAVRDGAIIPSYDQVVRRDEAVTLLREAFQLFPDSDIKIYAPEDFGLAHQELTLTNLLDPKNLKREYQLRLLGFPWGAVAVVLGIVGISVIGWVEYQNYLREEARKAEEAERIRREQELAELNAKARAEQQAKALEHPWAKLPAAGDLVKTCTQEVGKLPLSIAGWLVDTVKCDGTKVVAVYRRNGLAGAPLRDFREAAQPIEKTGLVVAESGEKGEITLPVTVPLAGDEDLQNAESLQETWISQLQLLGVSFRLEEKPVVLPAPPAPPGEKPLPPPVATWRLFPVSFESGINPSVILSGIKDQRGVRIKAMDAVVNRDGGVKWSVQGELYGQK